jgi:hypothetical protein
MSGHPAGEALTMDLPEIAQLVAFVALVSVLLILLEMGLRRVAKQRPHR